MRLQMRLRESHTDLHRPAATHRVAVGQEDADERHHADEVFEDFAQLAFCRDRVIRSR